MICNLLNMPWCFCILHYLCLEPWPLCLSGKLPFFILECVQTQRNDKCKIKIFLIRVVFPTPSTLLPAQTQIHLLHILPHHSTLHLPPLALTLPPYKYLFADCLLKAGNMLFIYSSYRINCESSKYAIILFWPHEYVVLRVKHGLWCFNFLTSEKSYRVFINPVYSFIQWIMVVGRASVYLLQRQLWIQHYLHSPTLFRTVISRVSHYNPQAIILLWCPGRLPESHMEVWFPKNGSTANLGFG